MKTVLLLILLAFVPFLAQADEIYKYVDDNGVVHYTDKPPPGAQKAKLPALQTYSNPSPSNSGQDLLPSNPISTLPPPGSADGGYTSVQIVSPTPDETYHTADAQVSVVADVQPALQQNLGHHLVYYIDGTPQPAPGGSGGVVLDHIDRGSHSVSAAVMDGQDQILLQSASVNFVILPPTVDRPAAQH